MNPPNTPHEKGDGPVLHDEMLRITAVYLARMKELGADAIQVLLTWERSDGGTDWIFQGLGNSFARTDMARKFMVEKDELHRGLQQARMFPDEGED